MYIFIGSGAAEAAAVAATMGHPIEKVSTEYQAAAAVLGTDQTAEELFARSLRFYESQNCAHPLYTKVSHMVFGRLGCAPAIIADCLNAEMLEVIQLPFKGRIVGIGHLSWGEKKCDYLLDNISQLEEVFPEWDIIPTLAAAIAPMDPMPMEDLLLSVAGWRITQATWKKGYERDRARR